MPGVDATVRLQEIDYLLIGETHGTAELPAAFAEIACAALQSGRPVVVGVEHTSEHQPALDAYLASDGGPAARAALLAAPAWTRDTRFSSAMADMIEVVRTWRARGADVTLAAFDEPAGRPGTTPAREEGMARRLIEAVAARPGAVAVALTGLGHADRDGFTSFDPPIAAMIAYLPAERTASLAFARSGGESWRCIRPEGASEDVCGPTPLTVREPAMDRGVQAAPDLPNFSGRFSPGAPLTASPPARLADGAAG